MSYFEIILGCVHFYLIPSVIELHIFIMDIRKLFGKKEADSATTSRANSGSVNASSAFGKRKNKRGSNIVVVNEELQSESESDAEKSQNENQDKNREQNPAKRLKKEPIRKYDEKYLSFGFICIGTANLPLPRCLLCSAVFKNSALKPSPLKTHLSKVHKREPDTSLDFFKLKKAERKQ